MLSILIEDLRRGALLNHGKRTNPSVTVTDYVLRAGIFCKTPLWIGMRVEDGRGRMQRLIVTSLVIGLACGSVVRAEGLSLPKSGTQSRSTILSAQLAVLDTRASQQYSASIRLTPHGKDAAIADVALPASYSGRYRGAHLAAAREAARRHGVPEDLFLRLVQQESGWNAGAVSNKGATGLAQLMPGTARRLGVDPTDPGQNLEGGARYLRQMYDKFGSWRLALAAYNAGPGAVEQYDGIPPYVETKNYVKAILG